MAVQFSNRTLLSTTDQNNHRYWAEFEYKPVKEGGSMYVFKGRLNGDGPRSGEYCAVKMFRKFVAEPSDWNQYKEKAEMANILAEKFNSKLKGQYKVQFLIPILAHLDTVSTCTGCLYWCSDIKAVDTDDCVVIEPYLRHSFRKFYRNSPLKGAENAYILQAFSHFTACETCDTLVCGLQGIAHENEFKLTNPIIHSSDKKWGSTDKGRSGIKSFFRTHSCNRICKALNLPFLLETNEINDSVSTVTNCDDDEEAVVDGDAKNSGEKTKTRDAKVGTDSDDFGEETLVKEEVGTMKRDDEDDREGKHDREDANKEEKLDGDAERDTERKDEEIDASVEKKPGEIAGKKKEEKIENKIDKSVETEPFNTVESMPDSGVENESALNEQNNKPVVNKEVQTIVSAEIEPSASPKIITGVYVEKGPLLRVDSEPSVYLEKGPSLRATDRVDKSVEADNEERLATNKVDESVQKNLESVAESDVGDDDSGSASCIAGTHLKVIRGRPGAASTPSNEITVISGSFDESFKGSPTSDSYDHHDNHYSSDSSVDEIYKNNDTNKKPLELTAAAVGELNAFGKHHLVPNHEEDEIDNIGMDSGPPHHRDEIYLPPKILQTPPSNRTGHIVVVPVCRQTGSAKSATSSASVTPPVYLETVSPICRCPASFRPIASSEDVDISVGNSPSSRTSPLPPSTKDIKADGRSEEDTDQDPSASVKDRPKPPTSLFSSTPPPVEALPLQTELPSLDSLPPTELPPLPLTPQPAATVKNNITAPPSTPTTTSGLPRCLRQLTSCCSMRMSKKKKKKEKDESPVPLTDPVALSETSKNETPLESSSSKTSGGKKKSRTWRSVWRSSKTSGSCHSAPDTAESSPKKPAMVSIEMSAPEESDNIVCPKNPFQVVSDGNDESIRNNNNDDDDYYVNAYINNNNNIGGNIGVAGTEDQCYINSNNNNNQDHTHQMVLQKAFVEKGQRFASPPPLLFDSGQPESSTYWEYHCMNPNERGAVGGSGCRCCGGVGGRCSCCSGSGVGEEDFSRMVSDMRTPQQLETSNVSSNVSMATTGADAAGGSGGDQSYHHEYDTLPRRTFDSGFESNRGGICDTLPCRGDLFTVEVHYNGEAVPEYRIDPATAMSTITTPPMTESTTAAAMPLSSSLPEIIEMVPKDSLTDVDSSFPVDGYPLQTLAAEAGSGWSFPESGEMNITAANGSVGIASRAEEEEYRNRIEAEEKVSFVARPLKLASPTAAEAVAATTTAAAEETRELTLADRTPASSQSPFSTSSINTFDSRTPDSASNGDSMSFIKTTTTCHDDVASSFVSTATPPSLSSSSSSSTLLLLPNKGKLQKARTEVIEKISTTTDDGTSRSSRPDIPDISMLLLESVDGDADDDNRHFVDEDDGGGGGGGKAVAVGDNEDTTSIPYIDECDSDDSKQQQQEQDEESLDKAQIDSYVLDHRVSKHQQTSLEVPPSAIYGEEQQQDALKVPCNDIYGQKQQQHRQFLEVACNETYGQGQQQHEVLVSEAYDQQQQSEVPVSEACIQQQLQHEQSEVPVSEACVQQQLQHEQPEVPVPIYGQEQQYEQYEVPVPIYGQEQQYEQSEVPVDIYGQEQQQQYEVPITKTYEQQQQCQPSKVRFNDIYDQQQQHQQTEVHPNAIYGEQKHDQKHDQKYMSDFFGQEQQEHQPSEVLSSDIYGQEQYQQSEVPSGDIYSQQQQHQQTEVPSSDIYGQQQYQQTEVPSSEIYGQQQYQQSEVPSGDIYGQQHQQSEVPSSDICGQEQYQQAEVPSGNIYSQQQQQTEVPSGDIYGQQQYQQTEVPSSEIYGQQQQSEVPSGDIYQQRQQFDVPSSDIYGQQQYQQSEVPSGDIYSQQQQQTEVPSGDVYGQQQYQQTEVPSSEIYGQQQSEVPSGDIYSQQQQHQQTEVPSSGIYGQQQYQQSEVPVDDIYSQQQYQPSEVLSSGIYGEQQQYQQTEVPSDQQQQYQQTEVPSSQQQYQQTEVSSGQQQQYQQTEVPSSQQQYQQTEVPSGQQQQEHQPSKVPYGEQQSEIPSSDIYGQQQQYQKSEVPSGDIYGEQQSEVPSSDVYGQQQQYQQSEVPSGDVYDQQQQSEVPSGYIYDQHQSEVPSSDIYGQQGQYQQTGLPSNVTHGQQQHQQSEVPSSEIYGQQQYQETEVPSSDTGDRQQQQYQTSDESKPDMQQVHADASSVQSSFKTKRVSFELPPDQHSFNIEDESPEVPFDQHSFNIQHKSPEVPFDQHSVNIQHESPEVPFDQHSFNIQHESPEVPFDQHSVNIQHESPEVPSDQHGPSVLPYDQYNPGIQHEPAVVPSDQYSTDVQYVPSQVLDDSHGFSSWQFSEVPNRSDRCSFSDNEQAPTEVPLRNESEQAISHSQTTGNTYSFASQQVPFKGLPTLESFETQQEQQFYEVPKNSYQNFDAVQDDRNLRRNYFDTQNFDCPKTQLLPSADGNYYSTKELAQDGKRLEDNKSREYFIRNISKDGTETLLPQLPSDISSEKNLDIETVIPQQILEENQRYHLDLGKIVDDGSCGGGGVVGSGDGGGVVGSRASGDGGGVVGSRASGDGGGVVGSGVSSDGGGVAVNFPENSILNTALDFASLTNDGFLRTALNAPDAAYSARASSMETHPAIDSQNLFDGDFQSQRSVESLVEDIFDSDSSDASGNRNASAAGVTKSVCFQEASKIRYDDGECETLETRHPFLEVIPEEGENIYEDVCVISEEDLEDKPRYSKPLFLHLKTETPKLDKDCFRYYDATGRSSGLYEDIKLDGFSDQGLEKVTGGAVAETDATDVATYDAALPKVATRTSVLPVEASLEQTAMRTPEWDSYGQAVIDTFSVNCGSTTLDQSPSSYSTAYRTTTTTQHPVWSALSQPTLSTAPSSLSYNVFEDTGTTTAMCDDGHDAASGSPGLSHQSSHITTTPEHTPQALPPPPVPESEVSTKTDKPLSDKRLTGPYIETERSIEIKFRINPAPSSTSNIISSSGGHSVGGGNGDSSVFVSGVGSGLGSRSVGGVFLQPNLEIEECNEIISVCEVNRQDDGSARTNNYGRSDSRDGRSSSYSHSDSSNNNNNVINEDEAQRQRLCLEALIRESSSRRLSTQEALQTLLAPHWLPHT